MTPEDLEKYRQACVRINGDFISDEYIRIPSDTAWWSSQYALIYREWQLAKFAREQEWGAAVDRARATLLSERGSTGSRGPTVDQVEAQAINDRAYVQAKRQEIEFEGEKVRLAGMLEALRTKRDMLVSLGAHLRSEMEQGISIKERDPLA